MQIPLRLPSALLLATLLGLAGTTAVEAQQQTGTITGRVVDAATLQPVASAQVYITSLNVGTFTRTDGRFVLTSVAAGTHTLGAQVIGFRTTSAQVTVVGGQTATTDFQMAQDALALDEIVVTGTPGGTQRRAIGNVVSRVNAEAITEKAPVANMQELMNGRTPGLDFTRSSGNVGTGSAIRIRGVSSLSLGSQPLIYVDGIRVDNSTTLGPVVNQGSASSALDDINPDDIASIEIIKGPAAATLYGTEASAGVIQIITKKGMSGAPQFTLSVNQGTSYLQDPAGKIGNQWGCRVTQTRCPTDQLFSFNIYDIEKAAGREPFKSGYNQGYSLGVRGGSDAVRYYLSADTDDQSGIVDYNWSKRISMRANIGVLISEALNLDVSTGYVTGETSYMHGVVGGGVWDQLMWAQGSTLETPRRGYLENTPEEFALISATREFGRFTGSATMTHNPFSWLTQRLIVGIDRGTDENQILYPRSPLGAQGPFRNLSLGDVSVTRPLNTEATFDWSGSAKYALGPQMQWTSSVGAQYYSTEENSIIGRGSVFASPAIRSIEGATNKTIGQTFIQNKSLGFFVQQELNYNNRVYLTGAVRMDDNSAFGSKFDAATYPKLSAAWVVSEEPFFDGMTEYVSSFRLRGAWGKAGRQPPTFAAVTLYNPAVGPGGAAAVTPATFGNPDVGPEISTELELGFEAAVLNDRLTTDFTYFHQRVRSALARVPLAPSDGFPGAQDANLGQLDNWGWEATVNAALVQGRNWGIDLGFTGSHSMNKVIDLGGITQTHELREGFPYPIYATDRIVSSTFDQFNRPVNSMCDGGTGIQGREPGGEAVPCSQTAAYELVMGTLFPQYKWGFSPSVRFHGLEVFTLLDSEFGRWGSETNVYCRHSPCYSNSRQSLERNDPVYEDGTVSYNSHPNDRTQYGIYDADFLKLREIGARYGVPSRWIQRTGIGSAAISLSARNIATLWQRTKEISGVPIPDVELTSVSGGSALMMIPALSSYTVSMRVTF